MASGERDVTLTIKVKDGEVTASEAKLKRLKAAANDVGSGSSGNVTQQDKLNNFLSQYDAKIQNIKNASKPAEDAIKGVTEATEASGEAAATAGVSIGALAGAAAIAVVGLLVLVAVTEQVAQHILADVEAFVKFGVEVGQMADDTGLAAETVSSLTAELESQSRSFNDLKGPINEFRKTIGQAAAGSDDARGKLKLLGIDGSKAIYDIDGAFKSVIATIVRTTDPTQQARLGFAAFGSEWVKLRPIIRDFPGDVDAVIRKYEELGVVLSGKDVAAAKEFNRTYNDLQNLLKGIKDELGREFLPIVRDVTRELAAFITKHRDGIISLAETFGNAAVRIVQAFESIVKWIDDHPNVVGLLGRFFDYATSGNVTGLPSASTPAIPRQPAGPKLYDYSRPQDLPQGAPDLAALDAARAQQEKELKDAIERNKKDWDAAIKLWENSGNEAGTTLSRIFSDLKSKLEKDGNVGDFVKNVNAATIGYMGTINQVYTQLEQLEDERARRNKATDNELQVLQQEQLKRRQDWANKGYEIQKQAEELVTAAQKKGEQDRVKNLEEEMNRAIELRKARNQTDIAQITYDHSIGLASEQTYIDRVNRLELDSLTFRKQELDKYLAKVQGNKEKEKEVEQQIALVKEQITQQEISNDQKKADAARKLQESYNQYLQDLSDQLDLLNRGGRPLTEYEKTMRDIARDYQDLDPAQKQNLLNIAAEIDAVKALQAEYEKVKDTIKTMLDYVLRGDFKGLGRSLLDSVRNSISDKLSGILATVITGYDPNATNNPVAKPIVKEITGTNKRLDQVIKLLGGTPGTTGLGGGLGSILSGINGGSLGGLGGGSVLGGGATGGSQGGSILDRLRNIFSTDQGGIFAPRDNALTGHSSRLGGIAGGIGDLATIAGGLIGGRAGGILSAVGAGVSIGAMFGPWGALIGGAVGLLAGIFAGDPKKKADKNQNIPALQKGFADATTQLNKILDDLRHLNIDPDEAITQATAIRADIASGFGIQFQSSKYRKQAQQMIAQQLSQADTIIAQIRTSAEIARGSADRSKRILPEFAGGNYFADFFKPNGLLPGMFDGRDNILAMISRGEMVLNPNQQRNIRAMAGFDVFAGAGIPNYPNESSSPKLAVGGIAGTGLALASQPVIVQPNFTLELTGVTLDERVEAYLTSDEGRRTQIKVVKKMKKDGDIT
jgi:hypothetical protein